jgi:hypothetical protein
MGITLFFFAFVLLMIYAGLKGAKKKKLLKQQELQITTSFAEVEPSYSPIGENEWTITTPYKNTFTLYQAPKETIDQLFGLLKSNSFGAWKERTVPIEMLIHESDMRCREIDSFLLKAKQEIYVLIGRRTQKPDWDELSELDRKDEIDGITNDYFNHIMEKPNCNVQTMYSSMDSKSDADEELIKFYGIETITPYMRCLSRSSSIQKIPASHYNRDDYELLVKKGLARKGKDIPIVDILPSLTLKEMNEIVATITPKPFTRKPKAIEFLTEQPNLMDLLSHAISFNQLFQALPLDPKFAHIDLDEIALSWGYDTELASAIIFGFDRGTMFYAVESPSESATWRKEMGFPSLQIH